MWDLEILSNSFTIKVREKPNHFLLTEESRGIEKGKQVAGAGNFENANEERRMRRGRSDRVNRSCTSGHCRLEI